MSQLPILPPFIPNRTRVANLVPFTYRDSMTMLEKIENLQKYVTEFVPEVNAAVAKLVAEFEAINEAQLVEFNTRFTDFVESINALVALINNKTGPVDTQHITLTANRTLSVDALFPDNHVIVYEIERTGAYTLTPTGNLTGTILMDPAPGTRTVFFAIPKQVAPGDPGQWYVYQPSYEFHTLLDPVIDEVISNTSDITELNRRSIKTINLGTVKLDTDPTIKIQSLLDLGYDLYLPSNLNVSVDGLVMKFDGQSISGGGTLRLNANAYQSVVLAAGLTNVSVKGIAVDGNAVGNPLDEGVISFSGIERGGEKLGAITFTNCSNSTIDSVKIVNAFSQPATIVGGENNSIKNCKSLNHRREGFFLIGGKDSEIDGCLSVSDTAAFLAWSHIATRWLEITDPDHNHRITNNTVKNSSAAHITVNTKNTVVSGNIITRTVSETVSTGPGLRLGHGPTQLLHRAFNCFVSDNVITNIFSLNPFGGSQNGNRGISVDGGSGSTITKNTVNNCGVGIGVSVTIEQDINLTDNYIFNPKSLGMALLLKGGLVAGNKVVGGERGIDYTGLNTPIMDNTTIDNTISGLRLYNQPTHPWATLLKCHAINNVIAGTPDVPLFIQTDSVTNRGNILPTTHLDGRIYYTEFIPTTGAWRQGDIALIRRPNAGSFIGYVCVTSGTPGVWKSFGGIVG